MKLDRRRLLQTSAALVAARGVLHSAQSSLAQTPETPTAAGNARLRELAEFFPLSVVSENFESGLDLLTFGDFALRMDAIGVDLSGISDPGERRSEFGRVMQPVPASELMMAAFQAEDAIALLGWTAFDIDQTAHVMSSNGTLTVLRGRWNPADVQRAWSENGYTPIDLGGVPAASISAEPQMDLTTELGRLTLGKANNVALVDDATLIYSSTLDDLESMHQSGNGEIESLGTMPVFEDLVAATPEALTGAIVLSPGAFVASPVVITDDAGLGLSNWEPGPVPILGLVGFVSGSTLPSSDLSATPTAPTPSGSSQLAVRQFLSEPEMNAAAKRTLMTLETSGSAVTEQAWREIFAGWQVWTDPAHTAVISKIDLFANEAIWSRGVYSRDAWYLYG